MALVSFEELEAAGPVKLLGYNPAERSVARTEDDFVAERRKAADVAERSVIGAAFQEDNLIGSFFSSEALGTHNRNDPDFDLIGYLKDNELQGYEDEFYGVLNKTYADGIVSDLRRKERNQETLAAAGWAGALASIGASVVDPTILIPGTGVVRGAKGGFSVLKTALLGGVATAGGVAAQEFGLQATQTGRTTEESVINIGAGLVFGGLIGAGAARLLSRAERRAGEAAVGRLVDVTDANGAIRVAPNETQGVGAQVNDAAEPDIFELRPREDFEVDGALAKVAVGATRLLGPVLRATQYSAASARQFASSLYENTIYRAMHGSGKSAGAAPETMINLARAKEAAFSNEFKRIYKEMRAARVNMSYDDFSNQVGAALATGDQGANPFVSRAAAALRREVIDPLKNEALRTQRSGGSFLLNEEDLGLVGGDESYMPRIYAVPKLRAEQAQWEEWVGSQIAKRLQDANAEEMAALDARLQGYETQIADLQAVGPERAARIGEIEQLGDTLDTEFADVRDLADDLTEATAAARAAETKAEKETARAAAKTTREQGGERLQEYLKRRAELRRRKRNLTADNADAKAQKRAKLEARMDEVREADASAVKVFSRRLKNIIAKIDKNLPGRAQELLDSATAEVERLNKLLAASEKRVAKLAEEPGEQPDGLAAYVARERAAAEAAAKAAQDLVDQLQDIAARGVSDADYDDLRSALQLKPVAGREARLAAAEKTKGKREAKIGDAEKVLTERQQELVKAQQMAYELSEKLNAVAEGVSARSLRRGEYLQRAKDRAAKLTPEEVAAQNAEALADLNKRKAEAQLRHERRWSPRSDDTFAGRAERYPFEFEARHLAREVYDSITGRAARDASLPPGITKFAAGPLKARTFNVPTAELVKRGWIETDARAIAARHTRSMAAEIELTRKFGRADMADQIRTVRTEYSEMQSRIGEAATVKEINAIIGKAKYGEKTDLAGAKQKAAIWLRNQEDSAIQDLQEGRDLMRGDFRPEINGGDWASVSRSVRAFNYITRMGGVALSSVQEVFRPAMVHGLRGYAGALAKGLAATAGKGDEATRLLAREAQLMNLATQRSLNAIAVANSDLGDPFIGKVSWVERLLEKGTRFGSRWNGINLLTDFQQNVSSIMSQHRIMEGVMGRAGQDGSFIRDKGEGRRLLAMLGIDDHKAGLIKTMIETYGREIDGVRVPNTELWDDEAAVRAYRAAVNLDVNSIISRKGLGDAPLWANTPGGAMLLQFSGYGTGAHSRVMIRGMQEDKARFVSGLAAMSIMGALAGYVASYRTADPGTGEKMRARWADNPMSLLGEGLDRSGIFPLLFDISNRTERITGAAGSGYRLNPLKSTLTAMGGGNFFGDETSRASEASGVFSGLGGPTVGTIEGVVSGARVAADLATGSEPPNRDVARALATIPYSSYLGVREILRWLHE